MKIVLDHINVFLFIKSLNVIKEYILICILF